MGGEETVHKVAALITRGEGAERELLVFRHPSAGIQLPAGTVERGEAIEAALLREVREETGLIDVVLVKRLATFSEGVGPDDRMITSAVRLRVEPSEAASWIEVTLGPRHIASTLGRGLWVRHLRGEAGYIVEGGFARIGYDLYDIRGPHDWVLLQTIAGWVPLAAISADVRRHLFHLEATGPTPDRWLHDGDVPGCELYWTPLAQDPGLVRGQDRWRLVALEALEQGVSEAV